MDGDRGRGFGDCCLREDWWGSLQQHCCSVPAPAHHGQRGKRIAPHQQQGLRRRSPGWSIGERRRCVCLGFGTPGLPRVHSSVFAKTLRVSQDRRPSKGWLADRGERSWLVETPSCHRNSGSHLSFRVSSVWSARARVEHSTRSQRMRISSATHRTRCRIRIWRPFRGDECQADVSFTTCSEGRDLLRGERWLSIVPPALPSWRWECHLRTTPDEIRQDTTKDSMESLRLAAVSRTAIPPARAFWSGRKTD
jgi:hypothetical protein